MVTYQQFLDEARKNPHLNPKVSINQRISDHLKGSDDQQFLNKDNVVIQKLSSFFASSKKHKNSFVSFTEIEKLGIDPKAKYNTPLGIYAYPSEYIIKTLSLENSTHNLPFDGNAPFANIFSVKPSANILNLNSISKSDLSKLTDLLVKSYGNIMKVKPNSPDWLTMTIEDTIDRVLYYGKDQRTIETNGGTFWLATQHLCSEILIKRYNKFSHIGIAWNTLLRNMGIDGCVDYKGEGFFIHSNKPVQLAVFLNTSVINKIVRYDNKWSPEDIKNRKEVGRKILNYKKYWKTAELP
jgi:hypothetical protein